jgi:hypothetical protein
VAGLAIRPRARSEGVEPPAVGVGDRDATMARARGMQTRMTDCARMREQALGLSRVRCAYQRMPRQPTLSASRRPGDSCWYRDRPEKHACARALDRVVPRSNFSAVSMRAIGEEMMVHRVATVNAFSKSVSQPPATRQHERPNLRLRSRVAQKKAPERPTRARGTLAQLQAVSRSARSQALGTRGRPIPDVQGIDQVSGRSNRCERDEQKRCVARRARAGHHRRRCRGH